MQCLFFDSMDSLCVAIQFFSSSYCFSLNRFFQLNFDCAFLLHCSNYKYIVIIDFVWNYYWILINSTYDTKAYRKYSFFVFIFSIHSSMSSLCSVYRCNCDTVIMILFGFIFVLFRFISRLFVTSIDLDV